MLARRSFENKVVEEIRPRRKRSALMPNNLLSAVEVLANALDVVVVDE